MARRHNQTLSCQGTSTSAHSDTVTAQDQFDQTWDLCAPNTLHESQDRRNHIHRAAVQCTPPEQQHPSKQALTNIWNLKWFNSNSQDHSKI